MTLPSRSENWVADLAFETALGYFTPEELELKFSLTSERRRLIEASVDFQRAVALYRREIDETGEEFRLKVRKLASALLPELAAIVSDDSQSASDRISAYKEIARLSGYGREEAPGQGSPTFALQINFSGQTAPITVQGDT